MLLSLALAACTLRPTPPGPSPADARAAPVEVLSVSPSAGQVRALAMVHAGSAYDPVGQEGLAYLSAHAALDPDRQQAIEALGGSLRVEVGREWVVLEATGPEASAGPLLALLAELLAAPEVSERGLSDAALQAERARATLLASPDALAQEALDRFLYEGHPYGHASVGRVGAAELITAQDLALFRGRAWVRESVHVAVELPDNSPALALFSEALLALPERDAPRPLPAKHPRLSGVELLIIEADLPMSGLAIGLPLDVRPGPLALDSLRAAASGFSLGEARLELDGELAALRTQPRLALRFPPMPASVAPSALSEGLAATAAWRASPGDPSPAPDQDLAAAALRAQLEPADGRDPFAALPLADTAAVAWVTDDPDALLRELIEESGAAVVYVQSEDGAAPVRFSHVTRIPLEGLLR